jgi:hypothetical protein
MSRKTLLFLLSMVLFTSAVFAQDSDDDRLRTKGSSANVKVANPLDATAVVVRSLEDHVTAQEGSYDTRDCVTVFKDGHFLFEHVSQAYDGKGDHQQKVGQLSEEQMGELKKILNAPEVVNYHNSQESMKGYFKDGDQLQVMIPREDASIVQTVELFSHFGGHRTNLESGYRADTEGFKIFKPYTDWAKDNVKKNKAAKKVKQEYSCTDPMRY